MLNSTRETAKTAKIILLFECEVFLFIGNPLKEYTTKFISS
ncbi:MAG: hypothetical protein BAJALOKI3v1_1150005 [Promethearchaeota archaeon]|nr:MAG: hypothetical protein BAJALOKI3v1_1150005 [Candidatus Lokiarchaeota archaeon]